MTEHTPGDPWTTQQILAVIGEEIENATDLPDRIYILRATDTSYVGRVHYVDQDDYEGVFVALD